MRRPVQLNRLINALADLYPDEEGARAIVTRAGVESSDIAFSARSRLNWTNIIGEALRRNQLDDVVMTAASDYPEVRELVVYLDQYKSWAVTHAPTPESVEEVAAQPVAGLVERVWRAATAWTSLAVGCFALLGVVARESLQSFLGIDEPMSPDFVTAPGAWASEGLEFVGTTAIAAATYALRNPLGLLVALAIPVAAAVFLARRTPHSVQRLYVPLVAIPLLLLLAAAKVFVYDAPTFPLDDVLVRNSIDVATFDVPAGAASRTRRIWTAVVCSRIADSGDQRAAEICGSGGAIDYLREVAGRYLLDVLLTILIIAVAVAVIRKLLNPSPRREWNLSAGYRWTAIAFTGGAALIALLPVPYAYSRTVRSMEFPLVCAGQDCQFYLCNTDDDCFAYYPAVAHLTRVSKPPEGGVSRKDVLQESFYAQLETMPPRAPAPGLGRRGP